VLETCALATLLRKRPVVRQAQAQPLHDSLRQWFEDILSKLSRKSETTAAIRYAVSRWDALTRYVDDGRIEIDNNAAERSLRGVALGRKNYLFAGSDRGGERARHLQPDRFGETQWPRSRSLSARSAHPHRRPPHQSHRGAIAVEHHTHTCGSVHLTYSWTLSKTVLFGRLLCCTGDHGINERLAADVFRYSYFATHFSLPCFATRDDECHSSCCEGRRATSSSRRQDEGARGRSRYEPA
jgi:hypothetical protein